jgi:SAM-dependent methyltransferase
LSLGSNMVRLSRIIVPKRIRRFFADLLGINGLRKELTILQGQIYQPKITGLNGLYERVKALEETANKINSLESNTLTIATSKIENITVVKEAEKYKINTTIHSQDMILDYLVNHPQFRTKDEAISYYFDDGFKSAQQLRNILKDICGFQDQNQISLFEFASGFGCVTRHLKNTIPNCVPIACDIHPEAIRFSREVLGIEAILSESSPEELKLDRQFDVVFALSFFSHMPKSSFTRWLTKLVSLVKPGGYLIFTTHGLMSKQFIINCHYDEDGFYFCSESEQKDISTAEYGTACVTPQYVFSQIFTIPEVSPKYFFEGYWWKHQDVFVIRRIPK